MHPSFIFSPRFGRRALVLLPMLIRAAVPCAAAAAEPPVRLPDVEVRAEPLKLHEEAVVAPSSVSVERIEADEKLTRALGRLPGVLARDQSGPGSLATAIAPLAPNAASTQVSVDGIPIPDPAGVGVNFSHFPDALVEAVEVQSPFHPGFAPGEVASLAPGGRIRIRTRGSGRPRAPTAGPHAARPWTLSALGGTASTARASAVYQGAGPRGDFALAAGGMTTKGDFPYRNPETGVRERRENNDASQGGVAARYGRPAGRSGRVEAVALFSRLDRTNPGPLGFPSRDHERDSFGLAGASWRDDEAFSARSGAFARLAGSLARVQNLISEDLRTDAHTFGGFAQAGSTLRHTAGLSVTSADNLHERLNDGTGRFTRSTFGATHFTILGDGALRFVPMARVESSGAFGSAADAAATAMIEPAADTRVSVSYGYLHAAAPIPAVSGYRAGGITVLANPSLGVERDAVALVALACESGRLALHAQAYHVQVRDRAAYVAQGAAQAQFVSLPRATLVGQTLDAQWFASRDLTLRVSATHQRAWDRSSGHELPFKPRAFGFASLHWLLHDRLGASLEEELVGKRFLNLSDAQSLSPYALASARIEARPWRGEGSVFFKVSNLLDARGSAAAGFPLAGRSYYLGLRL